MRGKCLFREHNAMFPARSRTWRQCGGLVKTDFILGDSRSRQRVKGVLCEPPSGNLAFWQLERSCKVIEIASDNTPLVRIFYHHPTCICRRWEKGEWWGGGVVEELNGDHWLGSVGLVGFLSRSFLSECLESIFIINFYNCNNYN